MACILIVDDQPDARAMLDLLLRTQGYTTEQAGNGLEALERLHTCEPCLVLLDLMMPVMNGWEFLEARSAMPDLSKVPVVVVSAAGDKANAAHVAGFIKKPADLERLLQEVERHRPKQAAS